MSEDQCPFKMMSSDGETITFCVKNKGHEGTHQDHSGHFAEDKFQKKWRTNVYCPLCGNER